MSNSSVFVDEKKNPVSPKVVAAAIAALVVPILLTAVLAGLQWVISSDGQLWLDTLHPIVGIMIGAAAAAAASAVAGYLKADPLRNAATNPNVVAFETPKGLVVAGEASTVPTGTPVDVEANSNVGVVDSPEFTHDDL